jgi:hypothetical protein
MDRKTGITEHQERTVYVLVLLLLFSGRGEARARREIQLKWFELDQVIHNKKVALVLPGGARVEGKVLAVEPEALRLRVSSRSDEKVLASGEREIPRASISVLRVQQRTKRWRAILTPAIPIVLVGALAVGAVNLAGGPSIGGDRGGHGRHGWRNCRRIPRREFSR